MPPGIGGTDDQWVLTARDAFNGLVLWRRSIEDWGWKLWSPQEYSVEMRFVPPFQVMRRMVAAGDRLFVTPGFYSPVHVLDAATGRTVRVLAGTERTSEILFVDGTLFLSINAALGTGGTIPEVSVVAVDPSTGQVLWKRPGLRGVSGKLNRFYRHANLFLTAGSGRLYMLDRDQIVCLDQRTGKVRWRGERPEKTVALSDEDIGSLAEEKKRSPNVPTYRADQYFPNNCTMVHHDGVVV
ncbi:MAG: outer membrane protein assembly factor BamB family protein, partial [Planctomycetota bacterium]